MRHQEEVLVQTENSKAKAGSSRPVRLSSKALIDTLVRPAILADEMRAILARPDFLDMDVALGIADAGDAHVLVVRAGDDLLFRKGMSYIESVSPFGDTIAATHGVNGRLLTVRGRDVPHPKRFFPRLSSFVEAVEITPPPSLDKKSTLAVRRVRHFAAPPVGQIRHVYANSADGAPSELSLVVSERTGTAGYPSALGILNHRFAAAGIADRFLLVSCGSPPSPSPAGHALFPVDECDVGFEIKYLSDSLWSGKARGLVGVSEWFHLAYGDSRLALVKVEQPHSRAPTCTVVCNIPLTGQPGAVLDANTDGTYLVRSFETGGLSRHSASSLLAKLPEKAQQVIRSVCS